MSKPHDLSGTGPTSGVTVGTDEMQTHGSGPWAVSSYFFKGQLYWGVCHLGEVFKALDTDDGSAQINGLFNSLTPEPPGSSGADAGWRKCSPGSGDSKDRLWGKGKVNWSDGAPKLDGPIVLESDGASGNWGGGMAEHDGGVSDSNGFKTYSQTVFRFLVATAEKNADGAAIISQMLSMNLLLTLCSDLAKSGSGDDPQQIAMWRPMPFPICS